jgi:hypothetical protein
MTRIVSQASCVATEARRSRCVSTRSHQQSPGGLGYRIRQKEKITMRIPQQVTERVKEAPAQALRAVFSGIGQVLLVADRIKNRAAVPDRARSLTAVPTPKPAHSAQSSRGTATAVKDETRWRSLDETGNVRLLSDEDVAPAEPSAASVTAATPAKTVHGAEPARAAETGTHAETAATAETVPAAQPAPATATPPAAETGPSRRTAAKRTVHDETSLPVPNYDNLTVASLRARLRNLDPSQVRALLDYEKANAGRADLLTMFERRIAKLESEQA